MTNKENLAPLPHNDVAHLHNGQRTPPGNAPGSFGLRPGNSSPFASSPFRGLSPNSQPLLSAQRDHSACRLAVIPLKVRKTRENLREVQEYTDIPPPCVHAHRLPNSIDLTARRQQVARGELSTPTQRSRYDENDVDASGSSLCVPSISSGSVSLTMASTSPPKMPLKIERHMSVSRRMLSKVKQSISQRQKSSESIRPVESEANLMRRLSGKRKQSIGLETRTQSSEIGRPVDYCDHGAEAIVSYHGTSRSSSDSTTSMTEFSATSRSFTPPLSSMTFGQELTTPRLMSTSTTSVASNTSSQEPTPRPTRKKLPLLPEETCLDTQLGFPYVDLSVNVDCTCADASSQVAVWIAISASIHFKDIAVPCGADVHGRPVSISDHLKHNVVGQITSLKLCFKPTDECHLLDIVGQKAQKNPRHNRSCSIFVKVLLPAVVSQSTERDPDQDSLFTELESIVGTLETELLSVEARYRHSLFPQDNIITIRHRAKVNRATPNSRWSILDPENQLAHSSKVHVQLARYLAQHYPPVRAIELIERCLGAKGLEQVEVQQIYRNLMEFGNFDPLRESSMPAVVVTDIDRGSAYLSTQNIHIAHLPAETSTPENPLAENLPSEPSTDEARTLWRALRHSSLTEAQQAELSAPDRIDQLEAQDEKLLVLRRRALANKRSVGAETLKGWKWECASGSGGGGGGFGCEMPWR